MRQQAYSDRQQAYSETALIERQGYSEIAGL